MGLVKAPRDVVAGALYLATGLATMVLARSYTFGSGGEMGPGYVPTVLGWILALLGAVAIGRGFLRPGEPIGRIAAKATALVVGSTALFGFLLPRTGLPVALVVLILVSAAASRHVRFDARALAGVLLLVVACSGVFVVALGLPMPLLGSWLGGG